MSDMTPREALEHLTYITARMSLSDSCPDDMEALAEFEALIERVEKGVSVRAWEGDNGWHADQYKDCSRTVAGILLPEAAKHSGE